MADRRGGESANAPVGARLKPPPLFRVVVVQLAVLALLSSVTLEVSDVATAASLASGGLCGVVPQLWFALQLFWRGARRAADAARAAYAAEVGKFLLSAVGFALVFALLRPVVPLAVFGGFTAMLLVQVAGGVWLLRRRPSGPWQ